MSVSSINPCINCGACCAYYRASFYWGESDPGAGGTVPAELTNKLNAFLVVMKGTDSSRPRCICLKGNIGESVECEIYPLRSSVCREFPYSGQEGAANQRCEQARSAWGLPPLFTPEPFLPGHPGVPEVA